MILDCSLFGIPSLPIRSTTTQKRSACLGRGGSRCLDLDIWMCLTNTQALVQADMGKCQSLSKTMRQILARMIRSSGFWRSGPQCSASTRAGKQGNTVTGVHFMWSWEGVRKRGFMLPKEGLNDGGLMRVCIYIYTYIYIYISPYTPPYTLKLRMVQG